jgi:hypothetical protein
LERIETWFLAVYKGWFVSDEGVLKPKNLYGDKCHLSWAGLVPKLLFGNE